MAELKLEGAYYSECQSVFRSNTNQPNLMLDALMRECGNLQDFKFLSVGSGSGLFEIPMLKAFESKGQRIRKFIGVDVDEVGSRLLEQRLETEFADQLEYAIKVISFDEFEMDEMVDIVLYNHVFEYIRSGQASWIHKSLRLLNEDGRLVIFSPLNGGINLLYEENMKKYFGHAPFFSHHIAKLLDDEKLDYKVLTIKAECHIELLNDLDIEGDGMRLLSFLTHLDCRSLAADISKNAASYYLSIARNGIIAHPTDFYIIGR